MGSSRGPHSPVLPDAFCYSPFTLPPVTANAQMSVSRVRGIAFMTATLSCKSKEERILWNTACAKQSSFLVSLFSSKKVSCLILAKAMEWEFLAHLPLRLAEFIHCSFTHSLTRQALVTLPAELSAQHWGGRGQRCNPGAEGAHAIMRWTVSWWLHTDVLFSNIWIMIKYSCAKSVIRKLNSLHLNEQFTFIYKPQIKCHLLQI